MTAEHSDQNEENKIKEAGPAAEKETEAVVVETQDLDMEELQADLAEWKAKAEEYLDGWQRARAEFANYKKRVDREQAQTYQNAAANVIKKFLDIADDLDLALRNRPDSEDGLAWAAGIELVYRKLLTALESQGVTRMQAEGDFFDPNLHEAISSEDNPDYESGEIIEVIKHGYQQGDRIVRPALVRVAR